LRLLSFLLPLPRPPTPPLFPYTTLFRSRAAGQGRPQGIRPADSQHDGGGRGERFRGQESRRSGDLGALAQPRQSERARPSPNRQDRKSTRLNSSHDQISYAVFCLKKKKN